MGGINYCLNALVAKGSIKIQNFKNNQNKWVYAYFLTPQGLAEKTALTGAFLKRKMQEYELIKKEIEALSREMHCTEIKSSPSVNLLDSSGQWLASKARSGR